MQRFDVNDSDQAGSSWQRNVVYTFLIFTYLMYIIYTYIYIYIYIYKVW